METSQVLFKQVVSRGCSIDAHKKVVVATIDGEGIKKQTRQFDTVTSSLKKLKEWLLENVISHVAMESTGVFWEPVYNVLEPAGITVWIVNAAHVKYVPRHKTDKKDSAWLCKLLLAGLLKPSYIPAREQRELRNLTRYRTKLVQSNASNKNRVIRQEMANTQRTIESLDHRIKGVLSPYEKALELLKKIPGISTKSAEDLVTEIGLDMNVFPTEKHLASWAGMCPGNNENAGKKKRENNNGNKQVKSVLTEIAWAATRTKNTFYHARYHKLAARRGKKKARVAVEHSILKSVYHILKDNCEYKELGAAYLTSRTEVRRNAYLKSELSKLDYTVELKKLFPVEKAG